MTTAEEAELGMTWQQRAEQWRRFSSWETARLREVPQDPAAALAWMAAAHELAREANPAWGSGLDREHVRHLENMRDALARMTLPS